MFSLCLLVFCLYLTDDDSRDWQEAQGKMKIASKAPRFYVFMKMYKRMKYDTWKLGLKLWVFICNGEYL